jgi:hypothetical protein
MEVLPIEVVEISLNPTGIGIGGVHVAPLYAFGRRARAKQNVVPYCLSFPHLR